MHFSKALLIPIAVFIGAAQATESMQDRVNILVNGFDRLTQLHEKHCSKETMAKDANATNKWVGGGAVHARGDVSAENYDASQNSASSGEHAVSGNYASSRKQGSRKYGSSESYGSSEAYGSDMRVTCKLVGKLLEAGNTANFHDLTNMNIVRGYDDEYESGRESGYDNGRSYGGEKSHGGWNDDEKTGHGPLSARASGNAIDGSAQDVINAVLTFSNNVIDTASGGIMNAGRASGASTEGIGNDA